MIRWPVSRNTISSILPYFMDWMTGLGVGTLFLILFSRLRLILGASSTVNISLLLTLCLAAMACVSFVRRTPPWLTTLACWSLACWTLLQPTILDFSLNSVGQFSLTQLTSGSTRLGITFAIVLASVFPFSCAASLLSSSSGLHRNSFMGGVATAFFYMPILLGLIVTPNVAMWLAVIMSALAGGRYFLQGTTIPAKFSQNASSPRTAWGQFEPVLLAVGSGFAVAISMFLSGQFMLQNLVSEFALFSGLIAGLGSGSLLPKAFCFSRKWLMLAVWGALLILLYPVLTDLVLMQTVWISNTFVLFTSRSCLLFLLTWPLGMLLSRETFGGASYFSICFQQLLGFTTGYTLALWSGLSPIAAIFFVLLGSLALACHSFWVASESFPRGWFARVRMATCFLVLICGLSFHSRLAFSRSEKLVFSGNVFAAVRDGVPAPLLPWIDDGRLAEEHTDLTHRWSLWKHRGVQVVSRNSGLVTETRSNAPTVCPMSAAEVLPGLFPLIAHRAAEHVLVLGIHSTTLKTCEAFPLQSLTVIEDSPFISEMQKWASSILSDPTRVQFVNADLQLALKTSHSQRYDVIIAPQTMSVTTAGAAQMSQEFYKDVRSKLAEEGLFCQRLGFYDLGPELVKDLLSTLTTVFPQVLVLESVPGELLLIATLQADSLITAELMERLQLPQTRMLLSEIGWDWSMPASRGMLDNAAVMKWISQTPVPFSHRHLNLAFQVPQEVARWDTKSQQTRNELAKHGMALGAYLGEGPHSLDIQQRLEDLQLAQNILNNQPDDIWSYRAALKKQLSDRPRAKIMPVKHEGLKRRLHPDDQRRKDYLVTLGELAKVEVPSEQMVEQLTQYIQPYDPLLGAFVSHEAIHQFKRVGVAAAAKQYHNLIYSIYFSTAGDKSVRNVSEAVKLLCDHPEIIPDDAERWDHLNGLVEVFRYRWQLRFHDTKRELKYETIDTERSIAALDSALNKMEQLVDSAGLTQRDWDARSEFIELGLMQPLKQHRSVQLRRSPRN